MSKLIFDHCFTKDTNHKFFKKLIKMGFNDLGFTTVHPKENICKFIKFDDHQYLEFISTKYKEDEKKKPGLSFKSTGKLKMIYDKIKKKRGVNANWFHRNYNWKENSKDVLPGWNFVDFKHVPFRNIWFWLTEYEPPKKGLKRIPFSSSHPNGVYAFEAIVIEANKKSKIFFEKLFGAKKEGLSKKSQVIFIDSKRTRHSLVILKCKSLKKAQKYIKAPIKEMYGYEGLFIKNPSDNDRMWDILIIEK
ncbi:MAG: hypothetical protein GY909_04550 [Oligoflexia bacterium]|nr:hypothetical protein [Oligoflexia bacterium]